MKQWTTLLLTNFLLLSIFVRKALPIRLLVMQIPWPIKLFLAIQT